MTIVKELNDLAEKMTGTNPNKKTIAKVLDYIEQNYTAGGGSSSGGESSAESDIFIVRESTSDGTNYTIDKTYEEISEAKSLGKLLVYTDGVNSTFLFAPPIPAGAPAELFPQTFVGDIMSLDRSAVNALNVKEVVISPTEVSVYEKQYTLTPSSL